MPTEFASYYDASGSESDAQGAIMVIGLVASEAKWRKFANSWRRVLGSKRFDVPYFHMKEFAHSKGPFEKWRGDDETRKAFPH